MYSIVTHPNEVLRKTAEVVDLDFLGTDEFKVLIKEMLRIMHELDGVGLAAPQIGVSKRIFVVNHIDGDLVVINPALSHFSFLKESSEEGCLSLPGIAGIVRRPHKVKLDAIDVTGEPFTLSAKGLLARVFQHENDHLEGIFFTDRAHKITKGDAPEKREISGK